MQRHQQGAAATAGVLSVASGGQSILLADAARTKTPEMLAAYGRSLEIYRTKPDEAATIVGQQAGVSAEVAKADMAEYDFVPLT